MKTTQVTLRNIDKELKRLIDLNAQKQNKSINTFVVDVVKDSVGYDKSANKSTWRKFAGTITADGINDSVLAEFEAPDPAMWDSTA